MDNPEGTMVYDDAPVNCRFRKPTQSLATRCSLRPKIALGPRPETYRDLNPHRRIMAFLVSSDVEGETAGGDLMAEGRVVLAWRDLAAGWNKRWIWSALALQDIKLRYRGSMLGPFWLTISTLITVLAMGVIYPLLFRMDASSYVLYLGTGLIVWQLLSGLINEGCETLLREESVIQ